MTRPAAGGSTPRARRRLYLVLAEGALVLGLLLVWIFSDGVRESKNLWVLFFYSFPSEFLVGLVPHEPVLIYYGAFHPAWVVAVISGVSTALAEGLNYSFFGYLYERPSIRGISGNRAVRKIMDLFARAPFSAILFAGLTPVPFFPVRFLVVMTAYPVWKYLLGVFVSRTPRFLILAVFGAVLDIPAELLAGLFLALLLAVNVPTLVRLLTASGED